MPRRRISKHDVDQMRKLNIFDLSGGECHSKDPDSIADNQLQQAINVEYDNVSGALKLVDGFDVVIDMPFVAKHLFYAAIFGKILACDANGTLYVADAATRATTLVGQLNGTVPYWCSYNGKIYIASGGVLQQYDGTALSNVAQVYTYTAWQNNHAYTAGTCIINASDPSVYYECTTGGTSGSTAPAWGATTTDGTAIWARKSFDLTADIVFEQNGRLVIARVGDDYLYFSGIRNASNWQFDTNEMNALRLGVNRADDCDITAIGLLSKDIIVFKSNSSRTKNAIYHISGYYPDWTCQPLNFTFDAANKYCVLPVNNELYFMSTQGLMALHTVVEYGDIQQTPPGAAVNSKLNVDRAAARLWLMPHKNQLWCKCANDYYLWIMHYANPNMAFTRRKLMAYQAEAATTDGTNSYFAIGYKLYKLSPDVTREEGDWAIIGGPNETDDIVSSAQDVVQSFDIVADVIPKRYTSYGQMLVKRVKYVPQQGTSGQGSVSIGHYSMPINASIAGLTIDQATEIIDMATEFIDSGDLDQFDNIDQTNFIVDYIEPHIQFTSGGFGMRGLLIEYAEVD
ncbi:hypothetical protein [Anaeromusa sp.]|uniref:hypothetical protein n=1 Tax=Anaeromusa sp. TaxID=1872520 RepID=UPI002621EC47|nr:hypothetical protein [Anaeromusa sp.]MDD3157024.1 hypothetical protein [Anaeromusa sp.]